MCKPRTKRRCGISIALNYIELASISLSLCFSVFLVTSGIRQRKTSTMTTVPSLRSASGLESPKSPQKEIDNYKSVLSNELTDLKDGLKFRPVVNAGRETDAIK